jgi:hypothetical protein
VVQLAPFSEKKNECIPTGSLQSKDDIAQHIRTILQMPTDETADKDATIKSLAGTLSSLSLGAKHTASLTKTPVFLAHSRDDEKVPFTQG